MAASGINEHHEACRKQNFINRQTYQKKILDDDGVAAAVARKESGIGHLGPLSSYELEKLHKRHGAANIDHLSTSNYGTRVAALLAKCSERRNAAKQSQYLTYSAKINGRLSSTDYTQQW